MIVEVKLEAVFRGKQVVKKDTPDEKEIDKVGIKIVESVTVDGEAVPTDKWLSTLKTEGTEDFAEGQTMKIDIYKSKKGDFFNFSVPEVTRKEVKELSERVEKLEDAVSVDGEQDIDYLDI